MGGGRKKSGWGVSWTTQSFRHQRRLVDDCSLGRGGMALVRSPLLTIIVTSGTNLYPPGVFFADVMTSPLVLRLFCFVLLCFVFCLYAFVEAAPIATRVSFFFSFFLFFFCLMSFFPSIFSTISALYLCGGYVVHSFLQSGVFLPCSDHGLDFLHQLMLLLLLYSSH